MPACTNLYLRKTDRIKLPLYALFDQTVFDLYAVELFEHGLCGDVQEKHRGKGVDAVHGEARDVVGQNHFCVYRPASPQKHRGGVHDAAVNNDGAKRTENAHRAAGAPEQSLAEQHTCKEARDAHGEHLPRRPRPLREQDIRRKHGHCADQKAGLAAEGYAGNDGQCKHGLKLRQHEKSGTARNCDGAQHGDDDELPRLRPAALENHEKRQHTLYKHERRRDVILLFIEVIHAEKQRQRNKNEHQKRRCGGALGEPAAALGCLHCDGRRRPAADGEHEYQKRGNERCVYLHGVYPQLRNTRGVHEGAEVDGAHGVDEDCQRRGERQQRNYFAVRRQGCGLFPGARLYRAGILRHIRKLRLGRKRSAACEDDILGSDGISYDPTGDAVSGACVKAVVGEKACGRALRHDAAVKKKGAAVGVGGGKLKIVRYRDDGNAAVREPAQNLCKQSLKVRIESLCRLVEQ